MPPPRRRVQPHAARAPTIGAPDGDRRSTGGATDERDRAHLQRCVEPAEEALGAGLGRIVHASSTAQLRSWLQELGAAPGPVRPRPVSDVAPGVRVEGRTRISRRRSGGCTSYRDRQTR
ncbi:hypothetical protein [Pseudonocardia sp. NPDC046786]|uniref:hypothetical protein n=1 Tax=Pseudonocardia sp. NPDC046786 TaxID=3155471 RepID=UPI00340B4D88